MKRIATALWVTAAAIAGQSFVSPAPLTTTEGGAALNLPFSGMPLRYQQIHGDLRGRPLTITSLSWRQDGLASPRPRPWWLEFDVHMAPGEFEAARPDFASNYRGPLVRVFDRRRVVLPDWTGAPVVQPTPFNFALTLDRPFVHDPAHALLWETRFYAASGESTLSLADGIDFGQAIGNGAVTARGTGCGPRLDGLLTAFPIMNRFQLWHRIVWYTPDLELYVVGVTPVTVQIPGLCAPLYVDPIIVGGGGQNWGLYFPYDPALVGHTVHSQGFVRDATLPGFPFRPTQALALTVPAFPSSPENVISRVYQMASHLPVEVHRGVGLVTRFN